MLDIPGLCGKMTRDRTVVRTTGQVGEDVEDDGIVSKDSDPDSGQSREEDNANEDNNVGEDDNFQVPDDEEIVRG